MRSAMGVMVGIGLAMSASSAAAEEFHVSPEGSASGDGSASRPWDLETALGQPEAISPGDTIWLHGGTYVVRAATSRLTGTEAAPIVVRSFPGEWAQIDGAPGNGSEVTLTINGAWTIYRDFELTNSNVSRWATTDEEERPDGLSVFGPNLKFINLIAHDTGELGFWSSAGGLEVYGCLLYNQGFDRAGRRGAGHGVYTQNREGVQTYEDNIIFGGYSFGGHAYTEGGSIRGYAFIGNVYFNAGVLSTISGHKDDMLIGGMTPAARILLRENMSWAPRNTTRSTQLGYGAVTNEDVTLEGNYFVLGSLNFSHPWTSVTMHGNTFYENVVGTVRAEDHPDNTYLHALPTETRIFVRPNRYEEGRALVVVYDWSGTDTAPVDLSTVLAPGDSFEIRNGQNYFADPVVTGRYDGGSVAVPLTGLEPAQPIGSPGAFEPEEFTGRQFNVFVVRRTASGGGERPDAGAGPGVDASVPPGVDASVPPGVDAGLVVGDDGAVARRDAGPGLRGEDPSCGCRVGGRERSPGRSLAALALGLALLLRRRAKR